jgi:hypothetical protein
MRVAPMARMRNVAVVVLTNEWTLGRHLQWYGSGYYVDVKDTDSRCSEMRWY